MKKKVLLGIDIGLGRVGWSILDKKGTVFYAGLIETDKNLSFIERLEKIYLAVSDLLKIFDPYVVVLESFYGVSRNIKTSIEILQVKGAILMLARLLNIKVVEIHPMTVKKVLLGNVESKKRDMINYIKLNCKIRSINNHADDVYDSIGVALTYLKKGG